MACFSAILCSDTAATVFCCADYTERWAMLGESQYLRNPTRHCIDTKSVKNDSACLHQVADQLLHFGAGIVESEFSLIHCLHYGGATLRSDLHVDGIGHPYQSADIAIVLPIPEHRHPEVLQNFAQFRRFHLAP